MPTAQQQTQMFEMGPPNPQLTGATPSFEVVDDGEPVDVIGGQRCRRYDNEPGLPSDVELALMRMAQRH